MFADFMGPIHYIKVLSNDKLNLEERHTMKLNYAITTHLHYCISIKMQLIFINVG